MQLSIDGSKCTHLSTLTTALEGLAKQAHCHWASIQRQGLFINGGGGAGKRCGGGAQAGGEALVLGMTCFSKSNISCRVWRSVSHPTWGHNSPLENDRQNVVTVTYYQEYTKEAIEFTTKSNQRSRQRAWKSRGKYVVV